MSEEKKQPNYENVWGPKPDIEGMKFALLVSCGDICLKKAQACEAKGDRLGFDSSLQRAVDFYDRAIALQEHRYKVLEKVGVYG